MEVDSSRLPDFLVVGAAKCGTTSLHRYMSQHPNIFMPENKEPEFFARIDTKLLHGGPGDESIQKTAITDIEHYLALFDGAPVGSLKGEASPLYLYSKTAAHNIKRLAPGARLIAVLRDPAERAYSQYKHFVRDGREFRFNFRDALDSESQRIHENWLWGWHYMSVGYYGRQLSRYLSLFDRSQIKIFLYEELRSDIDAVLRQAFEFIGVDASFKCDTSFLYNVSGNPRSRLLHRLIYSDYGAKETLKRAIPRRVRKKIVNLLKRRNLSPFPPLNSTDRQYLIDKYRSDIHDLEGLIGKDLSRWLT